MSEPRRHHYCPQFYLSAFTEDGTRDGRLWVIDKRSGKVRHSKPDNEAHQRDFYKMEVAADSDPFALEKEFSKIETGASVAIKHLLEGMTLPDEEGMGFLLSFIGLLAVRTPWQRANWGDFMEKVAKMMMSLTVENKERWSQTMKRVKDAGYNIPEDVSYEEMADFIRGDKYRVNVHQNEQLRTMLDAANTLTDLLIRRNWFVVSAANGGFVCSDNPVGLVWSKPMGPYSPGFGVPGTEVTVPLSKGVGLIGIFEPIKTTVASLDEEGVATFNNAAIGRATRFIYAPKGDFSWRPDTGEVANLQEFL